MSNIVDFLKGKEDLVFLGGVDSNTIDSYQIEKKMTFADDYKEYLRCFGVATWDGHELTGICKSKRLDVYSCTMKWRTINTSVPSDMYVVEDPAIDDVVIWQNPKGDIFQSIGKAAPVKIAKSLVEYLTE